MKKYVFDGHEYLKLSDLLNEIKILRSRIYSSCESEDEVETYFDAYYMLLESIYREECKEVTSEEDIEDLLDLKGEYIVGRFHKDSGKIDSFVRWENNEAIIGDLEEAMIFDYGGMAEVTADMLGGYCEGWNFIDVSEEHLKYVDNLL